MILPQIPPAQFETIGVSQAALREAFLVLLPNVLGIVIYLIFIFEFYRFVARRDVFQLRLRRYAHGPIGRGIAALENALRVLFYLFEYVVLYPVLIILWYLAFVSFLSFLAFGLGTETLLLIAMAVVASIRITAYYSEDLSRDLAKMLPLALLGVVILQGAEAISVQESVALVVEIPTYWRRILTYLLLLIPLEFGLRMLRILVTGQLGTDMEPALETEPDPDADREDD